MTISGNAAPAPQGYGSHGSGGGIYLFHSNPSMRYVSIKNNVTILHQLVCCLNEINSIEDIVLGISEGTDNLPFAD